MPPPPHNPAAIISSAATHRPRVAAADSRVRRLIKQADREVVEEWKWRGIPVWSHDGMICTGETYKDKVKITFAERASLQDPEGLLNASLEGSTRRAIETSG